MEAKTKIKRKINICASKRCSLCEFGVNDVPEDCEHIMKHILDTKEEGFVLRNRRSGKTQEIIRRAKEMVDNGDEVIVLVINSHEARRLQKMAMGTGISFMAVQRKQDINRALLGLRAANIFTDDLPKWVAKEVMEQTYHHFVLGYYSPE